ncbi:hypothetical protein BG011_000578 [Mortierella polycephala]|uniref:CID domain-containing protein n=1 Tax=Mortierella polycephala TaxID=41804 RepID=A0A9P6U6P6_9FUNG|nr:hypothetical protein BG011_000578 [Mortierella polycephala]
MDPQQGHSFPQGGAAHGSVETRPSAEHLQTFAQHALDAFAQQSRGLAPQDINIFKDHLELLMKDCSQANIQAGKNWVVHHCQNPLQYDLLARAMVAIAISRQTFNDKLHIIYLTNDILSHCERKQQQWIKDAIYPHLVALLRVAYFFPGVDDSQRQRVTKPDAEYYETMSAYVSVPLQQDNTKREAMLAMVDEFVAENNMSLKSEDISKSNEGWHEGYLNEFYQTVAKRRKRAFSKNPESSRDGRGRDRANDSRAKERRRSVSRSRSRSRAKNRSRTRSRTPSRSRRRSRSYSRSISRSHSHSRSRGRSPGYRRRVVGSRERDGSRSRSRSRGRSWNKQYGRSRSRNRSRSHSRDRDVKRREMEDVFPARSFAGLGSRGGASSTASRPSFQPARHP